MTVQNPRHPLKVVHMRPLPRASNRNFLRPRMTMMQRPWSRKRLKTMVEQSEGLVRLKVKHAKVEQQELTS